MASRVNTKFVGLLALVLILAFGAVAGSAAFFLYNTAADLARMGDKKMALTQYKEAGDLYAKAVNKDKVNSAYLKKWIEALQKQTPDTQQRYLDAYRNLSGARRQLAMVGHDVATQRDYLEALKAEMVPSPFRRESYDGFLHDADTLIAQHNAEAPGGPADQLKRYRGLAKLRVAIESPDAPHDYLDAAKADLEAALAANPADSESARGLEKLYLFQAAKAYSDNKDDEGKAAFDNGGKVVADFLQKNPGNPSMLLTQMRRELDALSRETAKRTDKPDLTAISKDFREQHKALLDAAGVAAIGVAKQPVDLQLVGQLRQLENSIDPTARLARTESLLKAMIEAHPDDANLIGLLADVLEARDDHEGAIAQYQKIVDMPTKPVCFEGAVLYDRRIEAAFRQAMCVAKEWQGLPASADRSGPANRLKELRTKLAATEDSSSLRLMLIDAEIAFMDGDDRKCNRLVEQIDKQTKNTNTESLLLGAEVARRLNEMGSARQRLEDLLRLQPTNIRAAFVLAKVYESLQDYPRALELLQKIADAVPDNKEVRSELDLLQIIQHKEGAKVDDPVTMVLSRADKLARDEKTDPGATKAAAEIRQHLDEFNYDPRLVQALALLENANQRRDAAVDVLKKGFEKHPDAKVLQALLITFSSTDKVEGQLQVAALQFNNPKDLALARYDIFRSANRLPEARVELKKATDLAPEDPHVLEIQFMDLLENKDKDGEKGNLDKAREIADKAAKGDFDHVQGATFKARLESAQGGEAHNAEAVRIMEQAVGLGGAQPEAWRLLGRLRILMGRASEAATAFRQALTLRPNDPPSIKDLVRTLIGTNQNEEALTVARNYLNFAQNDPEFIEMWLSLEAGMGDRKLVMDRREKIAKIDPSNRSNNLALAAIYMDAGQFADARPLIDRVRADKDGLDALTLDAGWQWAQKDHDKAKAIFEAYITSTSEKTQDKAQKAQPLLAYAEFLFQRQDIDAGLAVLDRARAFQDPAIAQADKALADTYFSLGKRAECIAACRRVLDAKADTKAHTYLKRMAEAMVQDKKFQEALDTVGPLMNSSETDSVALMLAADAKHGLKDMRGERELLDKAVSQFPTDPMVFVKRGQSMLAADTATVQALKITKPTEYEETMRQLGEAVRDFDKALQIAPQMWAALRMRATAYDQMGRTDDAVNDLRQALLANPGDNDLMNGLVTYLLRNNRPDDAEAMARDVMHLRNDPMGYFNVAQIFAGAEKWDAAGRFLKNAFDIDAQESITQGYLDCLLNAKPPDVAGAAAALSDTRVAPKIAQSAGLLMDQARVQMAQGKAALAARSAGESLKLRKPEDPRAMLSWYTDAKRLQPDSKQLADFLRETLQLGVNADWVNYFRATTLMAEPSTRDQGIELMKASIQQGKIPALRQLAMRSLGASLYEFDRFDEAAAMMRDTLKEFPKDGETMNNLAYTLAKKLNKPQEALPLAQESAAIRPDSADVQDTLGVILFMTGKTDEAVSALRKAESLIQTAQDGATISIHLADALAAQGRKEEARNKLDQADKFMDELPTGTPDQVKTKDQTKAESSAVRQKIAGP